jgi:hypothetical protein
MPPQADTVQPPCGSDYSLQKDGTRREDGKAVKGAVDDFARRKGRQPPVQKAVLLAPTPAAPTAWQGHKASGPGGATHSLVEPLSRPDPVVLPSACAKVAPYRTAFTRLSTPRRQLQIAHRDNQRAFMWEAWLMRR